MHTVHAAARWLDKVLQRVVHAAVLRRAEPLIERRLDHEQRTRRLLSSACDCFSLLLLLVTLAQQRCGRQMSLRHLRCGGGGISLGLQ